MKQCRSCYRFSMPQVPSCIYCGSPDLVPVTIDCGESFPNYKFYLDEIVLNDRSYRIAGLINRGGSSSILQVTDASGAAFALKVPFLFDNHFTSNRGNSERDIRNSLKYVQSEIANLKKLSCGGFLHVHATGRARAEAGGQSVVFPYILMELANTTVKHLIQAELRGALYVPFAEKMRMILDFVFSLKTLHEAHVVHRDLSPDNIFSVNRDGQIRYIISDFGTSKHREDIGSSLSSQIFSHDFYLDPERVTNRSFRYDERSDIWSAGVIISEIIAGNFWVNIIRNPLNLDVKVLDFTADILEPVIRTRVDPELYRILCRSVHRDPEKRYQKINELYDDLQTFFGNISLENYGKLTLPNVMYLNVFLTLPLPLALGDAAPPTDIAFDGVVNLELSSLADFRIQFPQFLVESATLVGTRLFKTAVGKNQLALLFCRDYFVSRYRRFSCMLRRAHGQLKIFFQIRLKYYRF